MKATNRGPALAAFGLLIAVSASFAGTIGSRFRVDRQPVLGLPSSAVLALTQTRDGYLWIGTFKGLARFDGVRLEEFRDPAAPSLTGGTIVRLFEDSHRNLWVGAESAGVVLIDPEGRIPSLENIGRPGREGRLSAAVEDKLGAVWLFPADGTLCRYLNGKADVWSGFPTQSDCRALACDDSGMLWVATDGDLTAFDPATVVSHQPLPHTASPAIPVSRIASILASRRGGMWLLADGRVRRWQNDRFVEDLGLFPWLGRVATNASEPYVFVTAVCEDLEGNLILGTYGQGVYWYDKSGKAEWLSSSQDGLTHNSVVALTVDREGSLWVGTDGGGLNRVGRKDYEVIEQTRGLTVQSVCEGKDGEIWIAYNADRVDRWNGTVGEQFHLTPDEHLNAKAVFADKNQRVWAGAWGGRGPWLFQFESGHFLPVTGPELTSHEISAFFQDSRGTLWFGMHGGLGRLDQKGWRSLTTRDGLAGNEVRAITEDREQSLWIGTGGGGLSRLQEGKFTNYTTANGLPGDDISSVLNDAQGVLWVGTSGGLARFDGNKWTKITKQQGLASDSLSYLVEDGQGNLWIGSNVGLMRVKKQSLNELAAQMAAGTNGYVLCRTYGEPDGLPADECTFGSQPGAWLTRSGQIYFPTVHGLAKVDPGQLRQNTNPPPVIIEAVSIAGESQTTNNLRAPLPKTVTIPPGKEGLQIQFASLNLALPEKGRVRYRLDDYENWVERPGTVREVQYGKLPQGKYSFHVTACNEDGEWNKEGASLSVIVLPPFWRTWWFLGGLGLCLLAAVSGFVHYVSTQRLQRQLAGLRQQEALERERARIARDLHDQLGANLTQVSLLGELAAGDKNSPADVEAHARQISQTARETTLALDEIVWTVNPSNDTLDSLINYVCKYAQDYFKVAGLRYRLEVPPQLPVTGISPELRHNVFLAAKEAINNVVKHAKATSAWLRLRLDGQEFVLEIEDNGRGLEKSQEKTGRNGLLNMRKRMEDIHGRFEIGLGAEGGTCVRLTARFGNGSKAAEKQ